MHHRTACKEKPRKWPLVICISGHWGRFLPVLLLTVSGRASEALAVSDTFLNCPWLSWVSDMLEDSSQKLESEEGNHRWVRHALLPMHTLGGEIKSPQSHSRYLLELLQADSSEIFETLPLCKKKKKKSSLQHGQGSGEHT